MRPGTFNSPCGRYTVADSSLPHQMRMTRPDPRTGTSVTVTCNCGDLHALVPMGRDALRDAWAAYDGHLAGGDR